MPGDFVDIGEGGLHPMKVNFTTGERMVWDSTLGRYERTGEGDPAWIRPTDSNGNPLSLASSPVQTMDLTGMVVATPTPIAASSGVSPSPSDSTISGSSGGSSGALRLAYSNNGAPATVAATAAAPSALSNIPTWAWIAAAVAAYLLLKGNHR